MKAFLDWTTDELNQSWGQMSREVASVVEDIEESILFGLQVLGDRVFARKWDVRTEQFSPRLNRALAEVEVFYFRNPDVRAWIQRDPPGYQELLKHLTRTNSEFRGSLESTTKSLPAVDARFRILGEALGEHVPSVRAMRIKGGHLKQR
jgi:hypothetical protein